MAHEETCCDIVTFHVLILSPSTIDKKLETFKSIFGSETTVNFESFFEFSVNFEYTCKFSVDFDFL